MTVLKERRINGARPVGPPAEPPPSTAQLVTRATQQVSTLVRDEIAMAKAELTAKGKQTGFGIGLFGGAALFAAYGVAAIFATIGLALAHVMPDWLAALIVTVALLAIAAVLALIGRRKLRTPPALTDTAQSVVADLDTVKSAFRRDGHAPDRDGQTPDEVTR